MMSIKPPPINVDYPAMFGLLCIVGAVEVAVIHLVVWLAG